MAGGIGGKLTDKAVKAFVSKADPGKKLADGGGLYLFVTPAGPATGANLQNGSTQRPRRQALEYCSVNTQQILDSLSVSEGAYLLL